MASEAKPEAKQPSILRKTILIIGGRGTIGSAIVSALGDFKMAQYDKFEFDITIAGSSDLGNSKEVSVNDSKYKYIQVDLTKTATITSALTSTKYDWVVACGGGGPFGPIGAQKSIQSFKDDFNSKGFGQIDLVLQGNKLINDNGVIVLTTGFLDKARFAGMSGIAAVNGMVNAFVRTAGIESERGIKINSVSPGLLTESKDVFGPYIPASATVDGKAVALAYLRALIGGRTGQVIEVTAPAHWNES